MTYCRWCGVWFSSAWCYRCGCTKHEVEDENMAILQEEDTRDDNA